MAFAIPGVGEEKERSTIGSDAIRGIVANFVSLDFSVFIEGTIGNLLGISRGLFLSSVFLGFCGVLWSMIPGFPLFVLSWLIGTMPIWLLPVSIAMAARAWIWYVQAGFFASRKPLLLEIKMPRELVKSPRGMEVALAQWHIDSGITTYFHRLWKGQTLPIFSLEIASFGGDVHFYVWCWDYWRPVIESSIYAQYPEVEIVEAEDYASKFVYDPSEHKAYCSDHRYEPRNDAYPLKTYIEFELDKDPKEEYKVDPLAQVIERLSYLTPDAQIWLQIVITLDKTARHKPGGRWWQTEDTYSSLCKAEIDKIRKELVGNPNDPADRWKQFSRVQMHRINEIIRLIERNMSKHAYQASVRGVYISKPENFGSQGWNNMRWIWNPMGSKAYLNMLRPRRWHTPFDYPYQDLWDLRWDLHARRFFDCYRRRNPFYAPYTLPTNFMSTEVLATLWHPVSSSVKSPGLQRIPAKKAEAPPNLPK